MEKELPETTLRFIGESEGEVSVDKDEKFSGFIITVQTNIKPKTEEERRRVKTGLKELTRRWVMRKGLIDILDFTNVISRKNGKVRYAKEFVAGLKDYRNDTMANISKVEADAAIEETPLKKLDKFGNWVNSMHPGRIHMHIHLKITHNTNIKLNRNQLYRTAMEILKNYGVNGVYINIKVANTSNVNVLKYFAKGQHKKVTTYQEGEEDVEEDIEPEEEVQLITHRKNKNKN